MRALSAQILSTAITRTAAMRELSAVEDKVRARKVAVKDYDQAVKEIKSIEPLYLYLPFELPDEELLKISTKLRKDYGKQFLIETKIEPGLLGGCALSYKGIYKDYSLKSKMEQNRESLKKQFA